MTKYLIEISEKKLGPKVITITYTKKIISSYCDLYIAWLSRYLFIYLSIYLFIYLFIVLRIHKPQNLWCHHQHCCSFQVTNCFFRIEIQYQNELWSAMSTIMANKSFQGWKLFPGPLTSRATNILTDFFFKICRLWNIV